MSISGWRWVYYFDAIFYGISGLLVLTIYDPPIFTSDPVKINVYLVRTTTRDGHSITTGSTVNICTVAFEYSRPLLESWSWQNQPLPHDVGRVCLRGCAFPRPSCSGNAVSSSNDANLHGR